MSDYWAEAGFWYVPSPQTIRLMKQLAGRVAHMDVGTMVPTKEELAAIIVDRWDRSL